MKLAAMPARAGLFSVDVEFFEYNNGANLRDGGSPTLNRRVISSSPASTPKTVDGSFSAGKLLSNVREFVSAR